MSRTFATDWSLCPYEECTNAMCMTCYGDDTATDDNVCTSCIQNAYFITGSRGDC